MLASWNLIENEWMLLPVPFHICRACPNKICCQKCRKMLFLFPIFFLFLFLTQHQNWIDWFSIWKVIIRSFRIVASPLSLQDNLSSRGTVVRNWKKSKKTILANSVRTFSSQSQNLMFGSCLPLLIQDNLSSRGTVIRNWKKSKKNYFGQ